jgi:hypothetical protein
VNGVKPEALDEQAIPEEANQTQAEKEQAIASVLPLLQAHYDLISRVQTARLDTPLRKKRPAPSRVAEWENNDGEYRWVLLAEENRSRYRLDEITEAIEYLHDPSSHPKRMIEFPPDERWHPQRSVMINALYCTYIDPFSCYLGDHKRRFYAQMALRYLASYLPGAMPSYSPPQGRKEDSEQRNREIRRLLEAGQSARTIARRLHCSTATIQAVKEGKTVKHGRLEVPTPNT